MCPLFSSLSSEEAERAAGDQEALEGILREPYWAVREKKT